MGTTNFDQVDVSDGYQVDGSTVINGSGKAANSVLSAPKLAAIQETVAYGDFTDGGSTTGTIDLSTNIPEGAVVVRTMLDAVTKFDGDTSATIQIGDGSDVDRYNTGTPDVFQTVDHLSAGAVSGTIYHSAAKTPKVTVTSNSDFSSVSAGQVTVTIFYYQSV